VCWGVQDDPRTLGEFEAAFATDEACRDDLARLRWPEGFRGRRCGNMKADAIGATLYPCSACRYQVAVIAGTIFQDTPKPRTMWFRAFWWVAGQKNGASAAGPETDTRTRERSDGVGWVAQAAHGQGPPWA
jgi:hypothetical protein